MARHYQVIARFSFVIALISATLFAASVPASACFSVIVGKDASATGEVLMGHNEDQGGRLAMQQQVVPRMKHQPGTMIAFENGKAQIPQVAETWGYIWSEARGTYPGKSFSDFFINEWGVAIVSDNCGPSKESDPKLQDGGLGYGLRKLVIERAKTAREAVEIAAQLIEEYGYFPSGRSYQIADSKEGWMLQIVSGNHYVARRVADDEVALIPNHYTIRKIDLADKQNFIASPDIITYAIEKGWYTPAVQGDYRDFDFAKAYQAAQRYEHPYNVMRQKRAMELITDVDYQGELPFAVKPTRAISIEDVKTALRTHYEGTPDDLTNGYASTPHYTKNRVICTSSTVESSVIQFRAIPDFTVVWRVSGRPCTGAYVPLYLGMTKAPEGYGWMDAATATNTHFRPSSDDYSYNASRAWWAFQDLQNIADPQYGKTIGQVQEAWIKLEKQWQSEQTLIEAEAKALYKENVAKGRAYLTNYSAKQAAAAWKTALETFDKLNAVKMKFLSDSIKLSDKSATIKVAIYSGKVLDAANIDLNTLQLGPAHLDPAKSWAQAKEGLLEDLDNDGRPDYIATFKVADVAKSIDPCYTDLWLTGKTKDGKVFVARSFLNVNE